MDILARYNTLQTIQILFLLAREGIFFSTFPVMYELD